jgi:uncharacterized protein YjbI with pentapeptide repeats
MSDFTREEIVEKVKRREDLGRADLRGVDLSGADLAGGRFARADLEGANLESANLEGADFKNASLREAHATAARFAGASFEGADLDGAKLARADLRGANLVRAHLDGADLAGAILVSARMSFAQLDSANLGAADLTDANLAHSLLEGAYLGKAVAARADFTGAHLANANLEEADLTEVDARHANVLGATLTGATLTGAKVAGLVGTGMPIRDLRVLWVDTSRSGDRSERLSNGRIPAILTGIEPKVEVPRHDRYLGRHDVVRDASFRFAAGARVVVDGILERCSVELGEGAELVIGRTGVLADCSVEGPGHLVVHGSFFERSSPGLRGLERITVSEGGALGSSVAQAASPTSFAFERGCRLRMQIVQAG